MKLPLVVAYVPDFAMGTSADTIEDALRGDEMLTLRIEKMSGRTVSERAHRGDDGLFETGSRALSAVLVLDEVDGVINVTAFFNPRALNPLPEDIFGAN